MIGLETSSLCEGTAEGCAYWEVIHTGATLEAACHSFPFYDPFGHLIVLRSEKPDDQHISNYSRRDAS